MMEVGGGGRSGWAQEVVVWKGGAVGRVKRGVGQSGRAGGGACRGSQAGLVVSPALPYMTNVMWVLVDGVHMMVSSV